MRTLPRPLIYVLVFSLSIALGWQARIWYIQSFPSNEPRQIREYKSPTKLINPLLYLDNTRPSIRFDSLHDTLEKYIDIAINTQNAESVSVYFRNLDKGTWTGVNEDDKYKPSSMLKVLLMTTYLKQADMVPAILTQKLPYKPNPSTGQFYPPKTLLKKGPQTIEDLIVQMIMYSDNDAAGVLLEHNTEGFKHLFDVLQIPAPAPNTVGVDFMSPRSFSTIFRILHNSSYLSDTLSEKSLELLTKTTFKKGLVAGVPETITVAHKFGEYTGQYTNSKISGHELHDCGIIYHPNYPYMLCVMTKGQDFQKLETVISTISKKTYDYVNMDEPTN